MQIKDQIQGKILNYLEKSAFDGPCSTVASVAGVEKVVVFEAGVAAAGLLAVLLLGAATIVNLICFLYPALASIKVVEQRAEAQCSKWLVYWMLYFAVQTVEDIAPVLFSNIPFYFWIKGTLIIYEATTPVRDSVMNAIDTFIETYLPASSASRAAGKQDGASNGTTAAASCPALLVRVEHVELSVDLMRETAVVSGASPEDKRPMFVEISLVAGPSREALGPRYKTQPLSGRELNFAYTLTLIPSALTSSSDLTDAALLFAVKEKCTFSEDLVVAELTAPIDAALLLRPAGQEATGHDDAEARKVAIDLATPSGGAKLVGSIEKTLV